MSCFVNDGLLVRKYSDIESANGATFRCILWGISRNDLKKLNNSVLKSKGANKTPIEVIREGAFGGTYFRVIYSGINGKWYRKSWKEFDHLKNMDQKYYCSDYYVVSANKYGVKCGTLLRF